MADGSMPITLRHPMTFKRQEGDPGRPRASVRNGMRPKGLRVGTSRLPPIGTC
jgi:hypothetical protein